MLRQTVDVILDAGHGGTADDGGSSWAGVRGPQGTLEKHVTLALAQRVAARLGGRARLTRAADQNLSLGARTEIARRHDARVFVSLHANTGRPGARGPEAFVHARARPASYALARELEGVLARYGGHGHGLRPAELAILTPERLPPGAAACLLEVDYLSDPEGERALRSAHRLDGMADAIAAGIRRYMGDDVPDAGYTASDPAVGPAMDDGALAPDDGDGTPFTDDEFGDGAEQLSGRVLRRFSVKSFTDHTPWRSFDVPAGAATVTVSAEAQWEGTGGAVSGPDQYQIQFDTGTWVWMPAGWNAFASGRQTLSLSPGKHRMRLAIPGGYSGPGGLHVKNGVLRTP